VSPEAEFLVAVFALHTVQSSSFYKLTANKHNKTTTLQECVDQRDERLLSWCKETCAV